MVDRTKFIPAIVALFVTFVTAIVTIVNEYEPTQALIIILSVLVGSYIVGLILKWVANTFLIVKVEEPKEEDEENAENAEGDDTISDEDGESATKKDADENVEK